MNKIVDQIREDRGELAAVRILNDTANRFIKEKLYGDAEDAYRRILHSLGETGSDAYRGKTRFRLAVVLQRQNKLFEAEKEMLLAYGLFTGLAEKEPEKYPDEAAVCAVKLGSILSLTGDSERSLKFYREAEPIVAKSDRLRRWFLGQIRFGIQADLMDLGRYEEAGDLPDESMFAQIPVPRVSPPLYSHRLSAVFDRDWRVFGWDDWEGLDEHSDAWKHNLTEKEIRLVGVNRIKAGLSAVIRLAEKTIGNKNDFVWWERLIQTESDVGWLYTEIGDPKAGTHYQRAFALCDAVEERFAEDDEKLAQMLRLRGLTGARQSVWFEDLDRREEERDALRDSVNAYRTAYERMEELIGAEKAEIKTLKEELYGNPHGKKPIKRKKPIKGWKKAVLTVPAVFAVLALVAGGLLLLGAWLYEEDPWSLPDFVEEAYEKFAYEPKPIRWYTEIEWQVDWDSYYWKKPYTYTQERADVLWDGLTERLGFESVPFAPGTELTHPAEPERTLTVDAAGAITYTDRTVFDEGEEPVCLFGPEGVEKAVEYLSAMGIDPSSYRYGGREYVIGDVERQYRVLPYGTKEYGDVSQTYFFTWTMDETSFMPKRNWYSIKVELYYDRLESVSFLNCVPVRQDPTVASPVSVKLIQPDDVENHLKENGIRVGRLMGPIRSVKIESVEWEYTCEPLDYFFTPWFRVSGYATDGFKLMPFRVYMDPGKY